MRFIDSSNFICLVFVLSLLACTLNAESRQSRTSARVLAKQTGATQFEEERYETHTDCNEHKHHLKKRASDEDVDYEVYQGVVGRPGLDFPIYPRIPKTSFSCRSFGNGYFADMETDCQVFHICEEGRKISFLCPNGTIFQQSELTCDWWFKVNCLGSPGYYAESAEILNKQRLHRVRPSVPVQGFNIVGGGLNIKPKITNTQTRSRYTNKSERRIDSSEQQPSAETVDFEDISGEKQIKGQARKAISNIDNNSNDNESQITAETSSFVSGRNRNTYAYEKPSESKSRSHNLNSELGYPNKNNLQRSYKNPPNTNMESIERARNGQRGQQRFKEEKKSLTESGERANSYEFKSDNDAKKKQTPEQLSERVEPINSKSQYSNKKGETTAETDAKPEFYNGPTRTTEKTQSSSYHHNSGSYSTARKLDNTRTTPFYTPTVPSVVKSKTTEGKPYYTKSKGTVNIISTTPIPKRLGGNGAVSNFFLQSSVSPKTTERLETSTVSRESTLGTTFRPFIIGMRKNHGDDILSTEVHRFSIGANKPLSIDDFLAPKFRESSESREYLPTTTPASTGPTYLPKSAISPTGLPDAAGGDLLLFAPNPISDESVSRNVDEMLKTMSLIKHKLSDVEEVKGTGPSRTGLDIPPSSGPDALISLAKYFAAEQSDAKGSNVNSLPDSEKTKTKDKQGFNTHTSGSSKPSDTTATITTAATPRIAVKADDIKVSLLSERTVDRYTSLFGLNDNVKGKNDKDTARIDDKKGSSRSKETYTPFPQIATTDTTIRELSEKPETRSLAQVFSNGLSKYLENPKNFREELQAIRPTEPPSSYKSNRVTPNFTPVTATDKTLFRSGTGATYLPTKPTSPAKLTTTTQSSIAVEINNKFDYSTQRPEWTSTTEIIESTTYRPSRAPFDQKRKLELSAESSRTSNESSEGEEFLHREQTQSFVKSHNELPSNQNTSKKSVKASSAYISAVKPTENPWNSVSQADFLDPLTINDGLMKESKQSTTSSPLVYVSKETATQSESLARNKLQKIPANSESRKSGSQLEFTSAELTTQRNTYNRLQDSDSWRDILSSYDLPLDTLPSSNGLQRIANRLFGGLNESEALHLKNVMQQAEHNRQVLRLLLLLIQTCDDHNGKALERSRKHLLNALIDMDSKLNGIQNGKNSHQKSAGTITTTYAPVTFSKRYDSTGGTSTFSYPSTSTEMPTMSTTSSSSFEETTKFEIRVEDPDEDQISTASTVSATNSSSSSDRRALELLKSLYSLAAKFTSRR